MILPASSLINRFFRICKNLFSAGGDHKLRQVSGLERAGTAWRFEVTYGDYLATQSGQRKLSPYSHREKDARRIGGAAPAPRTAGLTGRSQKLGTGVRHTPIWTECPSSGRPVRTAARMSLREFDIYQGGLILWCPHCKDSHRAPKAKLWQETFFLDAGLAPRAGPYSQHSL